MKDFVSYEKNTRKSFTERTSPCEGSPNAQNIVSFPSYQSPYTSEENPNNKFLNPHVNIRPVYQLYVEVVKKQGNL